MGLEFGKFRESKGDFKRSTKRNFQISKIQRPRLRGLFLSNGIKNEKNMVHVQFRIFGKLF
jgi:hypothetical protein